MAFVKARKGNKTIKVSKKAFEAMFRDRGYSLIEEPEQSIEHTQPIMQDDDFEEPEEVEETEQEFDVEEVPISQMSKKQLMEYAKKHNIDTSGAEKVEEARAIIRKAVKERCN